MQKIRYNNGMHNVYICIYDAHGVAGFGAHSTRKPGLDPGTTLHAVPVGVPVALNPALTHLAPPQLNGSSFHHDALLTPAQYRSPLTVPSLRITTCGAPYQPMPVFWHTTRNPALAPGTVAHDVPVGVPAALNPALTHLAPFQSAGSSAL